MVKYFVPEVSEGEFIGEYQVLGVLGRGRMGTTYHVLSNVLGKEFVLKTLLDSPDIDLEWRDRLEAQSSVLSRLKSPNIDGVLGTGQGNGLWFQLKDFVDDGAGNSCSLRAFQKSMGESYRLIRSTILYAKFS